MLLPSSAPPFPASRRGPLSQHLPTPTNTASVHKAPFLDLNTSRMCHHTYYTRACGCSTIVEVPSRIARCDAQHACYPDLCSITTEIITPPASQATWLCRSCDGVKYDSRLRRWKLGTSPYVNESAPQNSGSSLATLPQAEGRRDSETEDLPESPIQATEKRTCGFWRGALGNRFGKE